MLKTSVGKPEMRRMGSRPGSQPGNGSGLIFLDLMGNQLPLGFGRPVMVAKTGIVTVAYHMVKGAGPELRA